MPEYKFMVVLFEDTFEMSKVDVIQVEQLKIHRWRWWSNWIDIAIIDYAYASYLVQMRVSRTNAKSFRNVKTTGLFAMVDATSAAIGDLITMSRK